MTRAERIAIAAMKGGVLKSTTSINLAVGLAQAGWRVLLVDTDAQANTTSMWVDLADVEHDLYEVVTGRCKVGDAILQTRIGGLSLLPSSLDVARLDTELIAMHRREMRVLEAVENVLSDYDAVIFDLPPSLSPMVIATLAASTSFIIPTDPSEWGKKGLEVLLDWSEELRAAKVLTADFLGGLLTRVEPNTLMTKQIKGELYQSGVDMFDAQIPKRTGGDRMIRQKLVMGEDGSDPDVDEAYAAFTVQVIQRVNEARSRRGRHAAMAGE